MGYMVDLIIVVFGLYWELNMDSKGVSISSTVVSYRQLTNMRLMLLLVIRLFGILRVWRIVRLMNRFVDHIPTH